MLRSIPASIIAALALTLRPTAAWPDSTWFDSAPVVVELFTSQGCSSCPPADAFLGELARRDDVLALSLHVDYWDHIGWKDPFASAANSERQRAYREALGLRVVYTPQMVIDGTWQAVGSDRHAVERAIEAAAHAQKLPVRLVRAASGEIRVILSETPIDAPATLWLALYDRAHETPVARGENAGRILENVNILRVLRKIGEWDGAATEILLGNEDLAGHNGRAVIVQDGSVGPVLGAAVLAAE